jgi:drug/metabolite transporter (DMT)-like permease
MDDSAERGKGILYASIAATSWAFLAIALEVATQYLDSLSIVFLRFALAFTALSLILLVKRPKAFRIFRVLPIFAVIAGAMLGGNYYGFMQGLHLTTPGTAQVIIQFGPVSLALIGIFLYKEKLRPLQVFGFLVSIAGFVMFYYDKLLYFVNQEDIFNQGVLFIFFGAFTWVIYAILQKKLVRKHAPQALNLIIYLVPALLFAPTADFAKLVSFDTWVYFLLAFLGINTLIAYGALAEAFKRVEANTISIIITLNPIITFVAMEIFDAMGATWISGEPMALTGIIGAAVFFSGAAMVVGLPRKRKKR